MTEASTREGFSIETFQVGEHVHGPAGEMTIVMADSVQVAIVKDGKVLGAGALSPKDALELSAKIGTAARHLLRNEIDDTGKPRTFLDRLLGAF